MSEAESKPAAKHEPRTVEPRPLSNEYHRARKQLLLWAGILLIWELVGVDLDKAKDAQGNIGVVVKSIKSPQAVPWVLVILVGYFLFKVTVEWQQCTKARRALRASKTDFISGWIVALLAVAFYIGQSISQVQFADLVKSNPRETLAAVYGGIAGATLLVYGLNLKHWFRDRSRSASTSGHLVMFSLGLVIFLFAVIFTDWRFALLGTIIGIAGAVGSRLLLSSLRTRRRLRASEGSSPARL